MNKPSIPKLPVPMLTEVVQAKKASASKSTRRRT